MTDVASQIERLVREVLAEMNLVPAPSATQPAAAAEPPKPAAPTPPSPGELAVTGRVVTLAELGERLAGVRRLVVPAKAIVTPAVRDELRRRNIELVVGSPKGSPAAESTTAGLAVYVHGNKYDVRPLVKALAVDGINVQPQSYECIIAATEQMARQLADARTLGVILTRHTAAGLCLANRHTGVRAILAADADRIAADSAAVGANLLVLDPVRSGLFRAKQILGQYYRQGPSACPKVFEKQLK